MSDPQPATPAAADWEAFYANYRKPGYVPGYELTTKLGGGQFGIVYRARKQSIGKDYAIKFLQVDDGEVRRAIVAELEQLKYFAQIDHPNLVSIEDRGEIDGIPYLVMSFAGSQTLRDRIATGGKAPAAAERDELLHLFLQACRGVAALHDRSLVHFDLKPANVFLKGNVARVGDYGLSKLVTHSRGSLSMGRGTPYYMAPELLQRRGDARSDIYSLGVMLFEILCGRPPFEGDSEWEVLKKHEREELQIPAHVRSVERRVLQRCLAKDPAARFQNVAELLQAFGAPAGAGAAAWTEVSTGPAMQDHGAPPLQPLPASAPQPPPPPPDPYIGLRRASREAFGHARSIAKEASHKARRIARKAQRDARAAWQDLSGNRGPKALRRFAAWQRAQRIHKVRRRREREERRANNGRAIRTAFVFLAVTLTLAFGGFLAFFLVAPSPQMHYTAFAPQAESRVEVVDAPPPAPPLFRVGTLPRQYVGSVSKNAPSWMGLTDVRAAERRLREQVARIDEAGRLVREGETVSLPEIELRPFAADTQIQLLRLLDEFAGRDLWDDVAAAELLQHAPESLAMAAEELAKTSASDFSLRRAAQLTKFLETGTGHAGLHHVIAPDATLAAKAATASKFGRLWLWYLNETAWSKQAWDRSRSLR